MDNVCVLVRVYNRVEDLKYCIDIIRKTWKTNNYFIIVVSNGAGQGYLIDEDTTKQVDLVVKIANNIGHFSGNSQLLLAGLQHVPDNCDYTVLLEADTWLYGDEIVERYKSLLHKQNAVWASAQFFRYILNLATDFAIVKTSFVKAHPQIFEFDKTPEYYVANYLKDNGLTFIYIKELMPINLPRYIKRYPFAPTGRFFMFPAGKMVTHHVESLRKGMDEKKFYFNIVAGKKYFDLIGAASSKLTLAFFKAAVALTLLIPYKSWLVKRNDVGE